MLQSFIEALRGNVVLVGLLVGAITPLLTSLIQQPKWSKNLRIGVSVAVSVVIGFLIAAADGKLDNAGDLFSVVIAVIVAAEAFYQKVWKASGVAGAVEKATTLQGNKTGPDSFDVLLDDPYDEDYGDEPDHLERK